MVTSKTNEQAFEALRIGTMYAVTLSLAVSSSGKYSLTMKKKSQRNITIRWIDSSSPKKNQKLRPLKKVDIPSRYGYVPRTSVMLSGIRR